MKRFPHVLILLAVSLSLATVIAGNHGEKSAPLQFRLTFTPSTHAMPVKGRAFVVLLKSTPDIVIKKLNWFDPEPTFARDIELWHPGDSIVIGSHDLAHPTPLAKLTPGQYVVQAVLDRDRGNSQSFSASEGNLYSKAKRIEIDPKSRVPIDLVLDQVYADAPFRETDTVRLVDIPSPMLTRFHAQPMRQRAAVILPPSFLTEPKRQYPVVYEVPGFGGDHTFAPIIAMRKPWDVAGTEVIWVLLDPNCRLGHHVFADSENNGPCGKAFIEELIPHIEKQYRGNGQRLVTGHSSGGWSSLWLQVTYPERVQGCWSTSPDPVDFHDFQRVDLYAPGANLFTDPTGKPRRLARMKGRTLMTFQPFSDMEAIMGHGGQLESFEAVFSPRGPDGRPLKLWDRKTGSINTAVAKSWEKYDIRLTLERNWEQLESKLAGKIHVYMGEEDTFFLEGATRLLKQSLEKIKADAVVELFPGKTHSLVDATLRKRMQQEMAASLKEKKPAGAP